MARKTQRREVARQILIALGHGTILLSVLIAPGAAQILKLAPNKGKKYDRRTQVRRSLERLEKRRLITVKKHDNDNLVCITKAGDAVRLQYTIDDIEIPRPRHWDGYWRLVMFDIPEPRKRTRDTFSTTLKRFGFTQIQKSVWAFPYPCNKELQIVMDFLNINNNVVYVKTNKLNIEEKLSRQFFNKK